MGAVPASSLHSTGLTGPQARRREPCPDRPAATEAAPPEAEARRGRRAYEDVINRLLVGPAPECYPCVSTGKKVLCVLVVREAPATTIGSWGGPGPPVR
jgi:hypothetical protein